MEVSSTSMNAASATVAAISQGFTLGFQGAYSTGLGLSIRLTGAVAPAGGAVCSSGKNFLLEICCYFCCGEHRPAISAGKSFWIKIPQIATHV
jgi:hypothetical protein